MCEIVDVESSLDLFERTTIEFEIRKYGDCMSDPFFVDVVCLFVSVSFFVESYFFIPLYSTAAPRDDDVVLVESDAEITGVTPSVLCVGVVDAGGAAAVDAAAAR